MSSFSLRQPAAPASAPATLVDGSRELARSVAASVVGSAVFGAAALGGYGARAMLEGAWMAPALVVGGAALSLPPLYLATALCGGRATPADVAQTSARALQGVSTVLIGLAVPAAFFSVTLRSPLALGLLALVVIVVGGAGVLAVTRESCDRETTTRATLAGAVWCTFALAVGGRLIDSLAETATQRWGGL